MLLKSAASKCCVLTCLTLMQQQRKGRRLAACAKKMHRRHATGEQNIGGYRQMAVWSVVVIFISSCFPSGVANICFCVMGQ